MPHYTTTELLRLANGALSAIESELKPKANQYFPSPETTKFFNERLTNLRALRRELDAEPRFAIHLLGSSQNGKSTLINVLMGRKILPEGHIGACSAAVVRCRCNSEAEYRMTVHYVDKDQFLQNLTENISDAETAWGGEEAEERRGEELRKALGRFVGFFGLADESPEKILKTCRAYLKNPGTIEFQEFGLSKDVPVDDQPQVAEHLAAKGRKAFVVDECILEGPFPDWPAQLELIDMPGTNDIDPFRSEVTELSKKQVSGLMFVTRGTQLGGDIINWFKDTSILEELAESTDRNQQRIIVVRTVIDDQPLGEIPDEAESLWPYMKSHCREQEKHFRNQLRQVVREKFADDEIFQRLEQIVGSIPVHFVSALAFRNLDNPALKNRVLSSPTSPANVMMYSRFRLFDLDPKNTGIPGLRKTLASNCQTYLETHFLHRMQSHLEKEVDGVREFFRQKRLGAELQLDGKAEAYRQVVGHVEKGVTELLSSTEGSQRLLGQIHSEFQEKASEILTHAQRNFTVSLRPRLELWGVLHWRTLRALGYKGGSHTTYDGREYNIQGDMAEIYCQQLRTTWVQDRDRLIELICGEHLTELVHTIEGVIQKAQGFALQDADTGMLVEQRMGDFGSKARLQLRALRENFRKQTESYESLRSILIPEIRKILLPTFHNIGNESGTGCSARMRGHLNEGVRNSLEAIHQAVRTQVLANWEQFIEEACEHTEEFVSFVKQWLSGLKELPVTNTTNAELQETRIRATEIAEKAEQLLKEAA